MSNRHLPAGQNIQGGAGGVHGADMVGGPGAPRRRQPPPYVPYQHHHQHMNAMYPNSYMAYNQQYYGYQPQYQGQHYQNAQYPNAQYQGGQYQAGQYQNGQYQTAQYQNAGMHSPGYVPYQNFARSPPAMPQYVPMSGVSVPPSYTPRPAQQQSPALSNPYQPPAAAPIPPQTPTSNHSSQMIPPPTPPVPQETEPVTSAPPVPVETPEPARVPSPPPAPKDPFHAPLPWSSDPNFRFPARSTKSKRRRRHLNADSEAVSLPVEQQQAATDHTNAPEPSTTGQSVPALTSVTSSAPSEAPETPRQAAENPDSPVQQRSRTNTTTSATSTATNRPAARSSAVPAPAVPSLPKASPKDTKPVRAEKPTNGDVAPEAAPKESAEAENPGKDAPEKPAEPETAATEPAPAVKAPPSSWANLFAKTAAAAPGKSDSVNGTVSASTPVNGHSTDSVVGAPNGATSSFSKANASSVAEAIHSFHVGLADQVSFLEPRGLINTGNMCYMNSVRPSDFLTIEFQLINGSKRAAHSFKSDTPMIDAMIMFMHEFKIIKSAAGIDSLRTALKNEELERYGDPFTPEFVYEAIRQLPRFASMRRGHQQDAEEFLGFLLQSLDDECTAVLKKSTLSDQERRASAGSGAGGAGDDWLEVGRKQKAAVSRSSGSNSSSPISRIFGGSLRSEFRVPGLKDSITTEPYQPLQLDIGSPDVRNVVDALRGLTRPERLQGDFNSPRGKDVTATKQVFIDTLPPVLILHLKRFQFDAEGNGTIKIWKKIGYPLELEIPREALSRQKRQTYGDDGMPKYRLISVVYHHGKNASGGHYTVDVRRQEGREWIRIDDTVIRRVRSEDVAEGGEEEEVRDNRKEGPPTGSAGNRFGAVLDEDAGDDDGWSKVTSPAGGAKKWSSVANGTINGSTKAKQVKDNIKDNKVAYLLFYQRV
ncbi:ubiquitin thiolesterase [Fusarium beomiforme]|uniref:ubiquitinyl hydrolase 1 n=1 Tax=Fusarium beomiforme TaxID=44412 RepID=A0A9P5DTP8_9HYPO|nr:ubiquitin thiolesterase [Fusarium beomiforme]